MKTIVFLNFTCARDSALLPVWQEAIEKACSKADIRAVMLAAVDAADEDMPIPSGVGRLVTRFDRKGNLNGSSAILGILGTIAECGKAWGAPVVKIDSDTVLCGCEWLLPLFEENGSGYVGLEGETAISATGCAYAMRGDYAALLLAQNTPWRWNDTGYPPEDRCIASLALKAGCGMILPWNGGEWCAAFMPFYYHHPEALKGVKAAVHCGQAPALKMYGPALDRTMLVRRMMRRVTGILHDEPEYPLPTLDMEKFKQKQKGDERIQQAKCSG